MTPKVSVIIPVYNVEQFLPQCLDSAINQTLRSIEIICINDGSTDDSLSILKEYAAKDDRIAIINKDNAGYGAAMNDGLRAAKGDYIVFLESDDYVCPTAWASLYEAASQRGLEFVKGNYYRTKSGSDSLFEVCRQVDKNCPEDLPEVPYYEVFKPEQWIRCFWINPSIWSGIYKKEFLVSNSITFNETPGASFQDTSFAFKVWCSAHCAMLIDEPIIHYRVDNESSSTSSKGKVFAVCSEMEECENYLSSIDAPKVLHQVLCALRYKTYKWNLSRIDPAFRAGFIARQMDEFKRDIESHYYSKRMFTQSAAKDYSLMAGIPFDLLECASGTDRTEIVMSSIPSPRISIIVPFFNQEQYLSDCLASVLDQQFDGLEIVLIDDGSTDSSLEISMKAAKNCQNVTILRQDNSGQSSARNYGLEKARGQFVAFLDSDDMLSPGSLDVLYRAANEKELDVLLFDACSIYETEELRKKYPGYQTQYKRKREYGSVRSGAFLFSEMEVGRDYQVSPCLALVSRDYIESRHLRFQDGVIHEDNLWTFMLLLGAIRASHIKRECYIRRVRAGSTMTSQNAVRSEIGYLRCLQKMIAFLHSGDYPFCVRKSAYNQFRIILNSIAKLDAHLTQEDRTVLEHQLNSSENIFLKCILLNQSFSSKQDTGVLEGEVRLWKQRYDRMNRSVAARVGRGITYIPKRLLSGSRNAFASSKKPKSGNNKAKSNRIRTLFIAGDSRYSGASMSLLVLARDLMRFGEDVHVILPSSGPMEGMLERAGIPFQVIKSWQWAIAMDADQEEIDKQREQRERINRTAISKIELYIKQHDINLVHTNTIGTYVGAQAACNVGVRSIWHIREFMEEDHGVRFWSEDEAISLMRRADSFICISESVMRKFAPKLGFEKCHLVYNGVDVKRFLCIRDIFGSSCIELTVCANFEAGKGQIDAVKAVGLYCREHPEVKIHLNLIGQHFKQDYVACVEREIADWGIESIVYLPGARNDMEMIWAHTDIAIVPSRAEAFGRCTIEAMLAGALVIGANTAGTAELIEDGVTGLLYEQGDPASLASAIESALADRYRAQAIAATGRANAAVSFPSDMNSRKVYQVHKEVVYGG